MATNKRILIFDMDGTLTKARQVVFLYLFFNFNFQFFRQLHQKPRNFSQKFVRAGHLLHSLEEVILWKFLNKWMAHNLKVFCLSRKPSVINSMLTIWLFILRARHCRLQGQRSIPHSINGKIPRQTAYSGIYQLVSSLHRRFGSALKMVFFMQIYAKSTLIYANFSGTFIEARLSMLNVSPVGRQCSQEDRDAFVKLVLFSKFEWFF